MNLKNWLKKHYKSLICLIINSVILLITIILANLVFAYIVFGIFLIITIYFLISVIILEYQIKKSNKEIVENE